MFQDLKYTLRLWAGRPWHTAFAVAALAIGIGANTGVFSVVNALLLRSLPFREPDRLALLHEFIPPHDSAKQFHDWRQQSAYLADAALFEEFDANLGGENLGGENLGSVNLGRVMGGVRVGSRAHVAQTSWNFFSVLGAQPVLGTGFAADEDVDATGWGLPGPNAVAVIGYGLWQQLFAGDPTVVGSTIRLDGNALTVVGVAPPGFDYPGKAVLWKPAAFSPGNNGWGALARLKPGISWAQARAAFAVEVAGESLKQGGIDNSTLRPSMTSLQDGLAGPVKNASLMFMGAVVLVLLIACTNVANLLLARTTDRAAELSIRSALGASRARIARQLLTECLLLAFVATLAGLLIAFWTTSLAVKIEPPPLGAQSYSILDGRVLAFTAMVSFITALALGVLPSIVFSSSVFPSLGSGRLSALGSRSSSRSRGSRVVRQSLVAAQVMLTMILLASSVCLGRAFVHLMRIDRGYDVQGIVTAGISLDGTSHQLDKRQLAYFEEVLDRVRRLPGVRSASATEFLPLYASAFVGGPFGMDGRQAARNSTLVPVLSGYFETMGAQILYGREFTEAEVRSGAKVAVVNERFAAGFGAPQDAVGHQLTNEGDAPRKIVGVVKGMEYETASTTSSPTRCCGSSSTTCGTSPTRRTSVARRSRRSSSATTSSTRTSRGRSWRSSRAVAEPVVMVHDYHLYTLPDLVRHARPDVFLHHFIHIPWTQSDAWRVLPTRIRQEIFAGLLANDIIGFHTRSYRRNFLQCCRDLMDLEVDFERGLVRFGEREVWVRAYPLPIDHGPHARAGAAARAWRTSSASCCAAAATS